MNIHLFAILFLLGCAAIAILINIRRITKGYRQRKRRDIRNRVVDYYIASAENYNDEPWSDVIMDYCKHSGENVTKVMEAFQALDKRFIHKECYHSPFIYI